MKLLRKQPRQRKSVHTIVTTPGVNPEGKPVVVVSFADRDATLDADEIEAFCDHLQQQLAAARHLGEV